MHAVTAGAVHFGCHPTHLSSAGTDWTHDSLYALLDNADGMLKTDEPLSESSYVEYGCGG